MQLSGTFAVLVVAAAFASANPLVKRVDARRGVAVSSSPCQTLRRGLTYFVQIPAGETLDQLCNDWAAACAEYVLIPYMKKVLTWCYPVGSQIHLPAPPLSAKTAPSSRV